MVPYDWQYGSTTEKLPSTQSTTKKQDEKSGEIIKDALFYFCNVFLYFVLATTIAIFGIVSNVINVVVYHKQGVKDSVTVTFIALSLWGLGVCVMCLLSYICAIIENHFPIPSVNFLAVPYVYFGYTGSFMYMLSTVVTMYLSVERCICIIIPFKVKGIFTKSRSIVIHMCIFALCALCFSPAWATQGLRQGFDLQFNRTRLGLWLAPGRREVDMFVDTFNGVVMPTIGQIVITVSAVLMTSGITTSAKFRQEAAGISVVKGDQSEANNSQISEIRPYGLNTKNNVMSSKDSKLAKIVVLVAIIFFISNLPVLVVATVRAFIPELDVGKKYSNLYYVAYNLVDDFVQINSSANIFVYYSVSSRYKEVFLSLFSGRKLQKKRK